MNNNGNGNGEFLKGFVKFFDNREGKLFGFFIAEDGKEYFFHMYQGQRPFVSRIGFNSVHESVFPKPGDKVCFYLTNGYKGARAGIWYYLEHYEFTIRKIEENRRFRVLEGGKVVWEGTDQAEIEVLFKIQLREELVEPLKYEHGRVYERMNPLGEWEPCLTDDMEKVISMSRYRVLMLTKFKSGKENTILLWCGSSHEELAEKYPTRKYPFEGGGFKDFQTQYIFQHMKVPGIWDSWYDERPGSKVYQRRRQHERIAVQIA